VYYGVSTAGRQVSGVNVVGPVLRGMSKN